jgi:PAS domain S-box-containing protein
MQDALFKSEEQFKKVFRCSPAAIVLSDPEHGGRLIDVSDAFEHVTGYRREEVVGRTTIELGLWVDLRDPENHLNRMRSDGSTRNYEFRFRRKDGDIGTGLISAEWIELDGKRYMLSASVDITEQKKAQQAIQQANEALAKAERHYRLMFNSVSDALLVHKFGEDGLPSRFHEVNDSACRHLGYTRDELLRLGPDDIDAPEERSATPARAQRIIADGHLMWEGTHVAKDGRRIPVEINTHLVDLDGEQTIISCVRDISERKEAEKQYRDIFEGAVEGIYRKVPHGAFLSVNPAFLRIFGYESVQDILNAFTDSTHQLWTDPNERLRFLQLLDTTGVVSGYECQAKRKDGTEIWVSLSAHKVCGTDGRILYHEGFVKDITERKRSEAVLYESERRLREMLENTHLVTATLDEAGNITFCNDFLLRLTGWKRDELMGRDWCTLLLPEGQYTRDLFSKQVSEKTIPIHHENEIITKAGERRTISWNNTMLFDAARKPIGVATIGEDITERKRMQDALRKSAETLATVFRFSPTTTMLFKLVDTEYRIADVNEAFEQRTGYRRNEGEFPGSVRDAV